MGNVGLGTADADSGTAWKMTPGESTHEPSSAALAAFRADFPVKAPNARSLAASIEKAPWPTPAVPANRAMADHDPELEQLAADPLGAPQLVLGRHGQDEGPDLWAEIWPAASGAGLPAPAQPPALPMPAHDRFGCDQGQVLAPAGKEPSSKDPQLTWETCQLASANAWRIERRRACWSLGLDRTGRTTRRASDPLAGGRVAGSLSVQRVWRVPPRSSASVSGWHAPALACSIGSG